MGRNHLQTVRNQLQTGRNHLQMGRNHLQMDGSKDGRKCCCFHTRWTMMGSSQRRYKHSVLASASLTEQIQNFSLLLRDARSLPIQSLELRAGLGLLHVVTANHHEEVNYSWSLAANLETSGTIQPGPPLLSRNQPPALMGRKEITPPISHQKA